MKNRLKTLLSLLLSMVVLSLIVIQPVFAIDQSLIETTNIGSELSSISDVVNIDCQKVADTFFNRYYGYFYGNEKKEDLEKIYDTYFTNDILKQYLSLTMYSSKEDFKANNGVSDFSVQALLLEYDVKDSLIWCKYLVAVEFKYQNCEKCSGITRTAQIVFDKSSDNIKIIDCYINDIININIRGDIENIGFTNIWENSSTSKYYLDEAKVSKMKYLNEISSMNSYSNSSKVTIESRGITDLQRQNMATYAINNCDVQYPQSGNSNYASYVDFYLLGGFDCTNFASHCLLAGGAIPVDTGGNGISSTGWYFRNSNNRSSSWSGVDYFYNFLINNSGNGPKGEHRAFTYNCPQNYLTCKIGDFIQINYENDTVYNHTTIVTSIANVSNYSLCPRITSRSGYNSGYSANNNVLITDTGYINSNYSRRVIHITSIS